MNHDRDLSSTHERMLVVQAQARDPLAFRELVTRYERRLIYYIRRILGNGDEAFDVMQEVWLTAFRRLSTLQHPEAFRVWLYKIAHDVTVSHARKRGKWPKPLPDPESTEHEADGWNELEAMENVESLHRALERLSPTHREVLTLRFLEQMELAEIANIVDSKIGTVKSRLHYAKRELRRRLGGPDYD